MASSQAYMDKIQLRQNYRNLWHTDFMHTIQADTPLDPASHTCFGKGLCTMTCQVADVEKVSVPNSVFALRFSSDLVIQLPQPDSCCKMSSISRPLNVTTALLVSCFASNNLPVYSPLLR